MAPVCVAGPPRDDHDPHGCMANVTTDTTAETDTPRAFRERFGAFRERFDARLRTRLAAMAASVPAASDAAGELHDAVVRLVESGGKRLRPALVYYGYRGCSGTDDATVMPLAIAVELLHTYLLLHDDIMDHAALRRGRPAAHEHFKHLHLQKQWLGDAAAYGQSAAILVGDLAHTYAEACLYETLAATGRREVVGSAFFAMAQEVIVGQHLEMRLALERDGDEEALGEVLRLKSGRYSVEHPLQLGALLAGARDDQRAALAAYGARVGEAFQLQDDLLGMFGDTGMTGKPVGSDLVEGKYTFLIYHALQRASPPDSERIDRALGRPDLPEDEVQAVCEIIRRCGARDHVQRMIDARLEEARTVLERARLTDEGTNFLLGLIGYLSDRQR